MGVVKVIEAGDARASDPLFLDWLREHDVVPENTWRVEVSDGEIVVHQYALTPSGKKYVIGGATWEDELGGETPSGAHGERGDAACLFPFTLALKRPIPEWSHARAE